MIEPRELQRIVADRLRTVLLEFEGLPFTAAVRERMQAKLVAAVSAEVAEPFEIELLDDGTGRWRVVAKTAEELAAAKARFERLRRSRPA